MPGWALNTDPRLQQAQEARAEQERLALEYQRMPQLYQQQMNFNPGNADTMMAVRGADGNMYSVPATPAHTHGLAGAQGLAGLFGGGGGGAGGNALQNVYTQTVADNAGSWGLVDIWGGAADNQPGAYGWTQVTQEIRTPDKATVENATKAEKRARELLLSHLDDTQRYTFEAGAQFNTVGKSGRTYRIMAGQYPARNVIWVHGGLDIAAYCTHPRPVHGRHLPHGGRAPGAEASAGDRRQGFLPDRLSQRASSTPKG